MKISGYQVQEELSRSSKTTVYRAIREEDGTELILKVPLPLDYDDTLIHRIKNEYSILTALALPGTPQACELHIQGGEVVLCMTALPGRRLDRLIITENLTLETKLRFAVSLAEILDAVHIRGVIHKDINPSNIICDLDKKSCGLIDFGLATKSRGQFAEARIPELLEGTLAYMAPEQSGRMNREVDWRSDLYALGATLYHLFTGKIPFAQTDRMAVIYAHMAEEPQPPHQIAPELPEVVGNIILRLMAKEPEERYQSAGGLASDLRHCLESLTPEGTIAPFSLRLHDISRAFRIPGKLYGRRKEVQALMESFARIEKGDKELFLVSGYSGIGKTSLINEIYKPVTRKQGYFISGKFDQFQREVPYAAFSAAFGQLARQILSGSAQELEHWRRVILAAVGSNGRVVTDVIPELEAVIGRQPPVPDLGPLESTNRFNLVFSTLVEHLSGREHPLVLFLDDLQWIDGASLRLLETLLKEMELGYFLLIGAYRDNEVDDAHPLMLALSALEKGDVTQRSVTLAPLGESDVEQLVSDTLHAMGSQVKALAELIHDKTAGNPFFVNHFLKNLYDEGLLRFDEEQSAWQWDLEEIGQRGITDNVVDLLIDRINRLEPLERRVLSFAACIGGEFSPNLIATIAADDPEPIHDALDNAATAGFLLWLGSGSGRNETLYRFPHDRIQQAAYSLIVPDELAATHLAIGQRLLAAWDKEAHPEEIFRITDQLNLGQSAIADRSFGLELLQLSYDAACRAKKAAAFTSALEYLKEAEKLAPERLWETRHDFLFNLYRELAESYYINADFAKAEALFALLDSRARDNTAKAQIYDLQLTLFINRGQLKQALEIGNKGLAMFDQAFPERAEELLAAKGTEFARIKQNLKEIPDVMALAKHPAMDNPAMETVMDLLMNLGIPAFMAKKELFPVVGFRMVNLSLEHGNCKVSAYGYGFYGMILGAAMGDYAGGYAFGKLALALQERFDNRALTCKLYRIYGAYIDSWTRPYSEGVEHLRYAYRAGIETGDLVYAGYCLNHIFIRQFLIADTLETLEAETEKGLLYFRRSQDDSVEALQRMLLQIVRALQGKTTSATVLGGSHFDEAKEAAAWKEKNYGTILAYYYTYKLQLNYLFKEHADALRFSEQAEAYLDNMLGNILKVEWVFYTALSHLAQAEHAASAQRAAHLTKAEELTAMMAQWAAYNPRNFHHKLSLLEGERHRIEGRHWEALACYAQGIKEAKRCGILLDEALGCELAAAHLYARNLEGPGEWYIHRALRLYTFWGAKAKVADLKKRFPLLGTVSIPFAPEGGHAHQTLVESSSTEENLDLESVMKNARLLSSTLVYPKLIEHLMNMAMETSGAQKAALLLVDNGQLLIEAEKEPGHAPRILIASPLEENDPRYPTGVLLYAQRSGQTVLLDDALRPEGGFDGDGYITANRVRSVLALPILLRDKVRAILYLENRSVAGAFTIGRLQVLNIFASQAAISLENAQLYGRLEQRVEAEIKKREEQEQIAIQQSKLAAMGEMIGNIAHQWRQPLTALGVLVQDLQDAHAHNELDTEYLDQNVVNAMSLLHKMSDTINDFQNFFKPDKSREHFLVAEVVEDTLSIIGTSLLNNNIHVEMEMQEGLTINGFRNEYGQVLLNLLSNAKDVLLKQQQNERHIWIKSRSENGKTLLLIEDNGGGIDEAIMGKIFEPYFTTKFKSEGTGIGLYMSKMIIERSMGGRIYVRNGEAGALFTVEV